MSMTFFGPFFSRIDQTLITVVDTAAGNLTGYVNAATITAATILLIVFGLQLSISASSALPIKRLLGILITLVVVSALATVPANYHDYISQYLMALPAELATAVSGEGQFADIGAYLDNTVGGLWDGIAMIFKQGGLTNLAPALIGAILFVLCALLCAAAVVSILMGKVGLALVVALGPVFIFALLLPWTKDMFTRWLSYALHFAVLQAMIAATLLVADVVIQGFVSTLSNPTWDYADVVPVMGPSIIMLVLAYLFSQLPSMASSLTGGIGLSMGNLAASGVAAGMGYAAGAAAGAGRGMSWAAGKAWGAMRGASGSNSVTEGGTGGENAVTRSSPGGLSAGMARIMSGARTRDGAKPQDTRPQRPSGSAAALDRMREEASRQNNDGGSK